MKSAPKDLLKEYVQSQQFNSTAEIMQAMKEMFRDVIEQVMEVEMDDELGRERCQRSEGPEGQVKNYRNGYSKKTVKTQLGKSRSRYPVTGRETMSRKSLANMTGTQKGWKKRFWGCMPAV